MTAAGGATALDPRRVRADFPILSRGVRGKPLVYLDSAATTQKPRVVLDRLLRFYEEENANVSRGVHALSERATEAYEAARAHAARFLGGDAGEIVFTRGTTESLNLVAQTLGRRRVGAGDEVLVTEMEHHSNFVPWQMLCEERGARLIAAPIADDGTLDLAAFEARLSARTRIVAVAHVSNVLGVENPVARLAAAAHARGAVVVVDGAQAAARLPVDVGALGCDFYAFGGHKAYGPTGIGVLWGRRALLEEMPPWQGGGGMIRQVSLARTTYRDPPERFEAGTPPVAGAVGLAAALGYLEGLGREAVAAHERGLAARAAAALAAVPGVRVVGAPSVRVGVVSFVVDGAHPHDVGTVLDAEGIAVRAGHHCAQPLMERLGLPATVRASFGVYSTDEEVEALVRALARVREVLG